MGKSISRFRRTVRSLWNGETDEEYLARMASKQAKDDATFLDDASSKPTDGPLDTEDFDWDEDAHGDSADVSPADDSSTDFVDITSDDSQPAPVNGPQPVHDDVPIEETQPSPANSPTAEAQPVQADIPHEDAPPAEQVTTVEDTQPVPAAQSQPTQKEQVTSTARKPASKPQKASKPAPTSQPKAETVTVSDESDPADEELDIFMTPAERIATKEEATIAKKLNHHCRFEAGIFGPAPGATDAEPTFMLIGDYYAALADYNPAVKRRGIDACVDQLIKAGIIFTAYAYLTPDGDYVRNDDGDICMSEEVPGLQEFRYQRDREVKAAQEAQAAVKAQEAPQEEDEAAKALKILQMLPQEAAEDYIKTLKPELKDAVMLRLFNSFTPTTP